MLVKAPAGYLSLYYSFNKMTQTQVFQAILRIEFWVFPHSSMIRQSYPLHKKDVNNMIALILVLLFLLMHFNTSINVAKVSANFK